MITGVACGFVDKFRSWVYGTSGVGGGDWWRRGALFRSPLSAKVRGARGCAMAFVPFEDCIRVESRWVTQSGKPMEISLWGRKLLGSVLQVDVDSAAAGFDDWADVFLKPLVNTVTSYVETYARDMSAEISFQQSINSSAGAGTRAGIAVEAHSAMVVLRRSGLVGRSASGRVYGFGGVTVDRGTSSLWTLATRSAWEVAMEATDDEWESQGFTPIIASPTLRLATGQVLLSTFPIVSWFASSDIAAVRARSDAP